MIKILIWVGLAYIGYGMLKQLGIISKPKDPIIKKKEAYKNLNIKDADFEDINHEEEKG